MHNFYDISSVNPGDYIMDCKKKKLAINKLVEIIKKYQNNEYIPRSSQDIHIGKQYKTEDRNIKTAIIYYIKQIKRMLKK